MSEAKEFLLADEGKWRLPDEVYDKSSKEFVRLTNGLRRFNRKLLKYGFDIISTELRKGRMWHRIEKGYREKIKFL